MNEEEKRIVRVLLDPNAPESYFLQFYTSFPYKLTIQKKSVSFQLTDHHQKDRTPTVSLRPVHAPAPFTPHRAEKPVRFCRTEYIFEFIQNTIFGRAFFGQIEGEQSWEKWYDEMLLKNE